MKKFNCDSELPMMVQIKAMTSDRRDEHVTQPCSRVCVCVCVGCV